MLVVCVVMSCVQSEVKALEQELKEINCNHATLKKNLTELLEISALLGVIREVFQEVKNKCMLKIYCRTISLHQISVIKPSV